MKLFQTDIELFRTLSKDDDAYHKIIDLIEQIVSNNSTDKTELLHTEALYQSLVDTLPMNVYRIDLNGKLTFGNKFLLNSLDLSLDELIGKTAYDFYPEADAQKYRKDDEHVIHTREMLHVVEENISPVTGQTHFVETYKIPIYSDDGHVEGIQGIFWDITERKLAEDAIRQSDNRANALLEAIPDTVLHLDSEGTFVDYLEGNAHLPVRDNLLGSTIYAVFPSHISNLFEHYIQQTITHGRISTFEYVIDSNDIHELDHEVRMVKVNATEVIAIIRDVTQRNLALQRELDLKLEIERGKLLTIFAQDASHEFRTPLSSIHTNLYFLQRLSTSDDMQKRLDRIQNQTNRLSRLVDMQLMIIRLNHPQHLNSSPVRLVPLLERLEQSLLKEFGEHPRLIVEHPDTLPTIIGVEEYVYVALFHVLENAYHFTPHDANIYLRVTHANQQIIIDIQDEGSGISEDALPHIFTMFWRKDEAHSTPGFGLGLSIVKRIIDIHKGEITVTSINQQGTHVQIILPAFFQ